MEFRCHESAMTHGTLSKTLELADVQCSCLCSHRRSMYTHEEQFHATYTIG